MIRHVVMWKLKPRNKQENMGLLIEMLSSLKDEIPEIIDMTVGRSVNSPSDWDMALVMDVKSLATLETYKNHPKHKLAADFSKRVSLEVSRVDFEI